MGLPYPCPLSLFCGDTENFKAIWGWVWGLKNVVAVYK
jgi:hypothetical protein